MLLPESTPMTPDEFLAWSMDQERRHELVDGVPIMMAGASRRHDQIVVNALRELGNQLRGKACRPFTADTAVRIPNRNVRLPDAGVDCGPFDDEANWAGAPVLVIEVLSPSTQAFDLLVKLEEYKTVASLRHILIVNPDVPQVICWTRPDEAAWTYDVHETVDAIIALQPPGVALRVADLYEGLAFKAVPRFVLVA